MIGLRDKVWPGFFYPIFLRVLSGISNGGLHQEHRARPGIAAKFGMKLVYNLTIISTKVLAISEIPQNMYFRSEAHFQFEIKNKIGKT